MEKFFNIITYFPGECIAIVIGVIGAIIAIAAIKRDREQKKNENQKDQEEQNKNGVSHLYFLIIFMVIICVSILLRAFPKKIVDPPETTSQSSISKTECDLQKSDFAYVAASSTYDGDRATHIATNLIDGKRETNWTEGVDGNGIGEYVHFEFQEEKTITGFRICSGNHFSDSYYTKNARPKDIELTFEDDSSEEFTLLDVKEELTFQLPEAVTTKTVRLTIQSVYEGSSWEDTVISEIVFLTA